VKINSSEVLEQRRIKYNLQKRELKKEEKETLTRFIKKYKMGWKDQIGYNYEINEVLPKLEEAGLGEYITYHNPIDPYEWSHTKTVGVDFELEIGKYKYFVEASYCKTAYPYRRKWFMDCRIPRFRDCPKPNEFVYWIVLTNRPENFNPKSVQELAKEYSISIMSIDNLLSLITNLIVPNTPNTILTKH
jgi:hypothetical protein